MIKKIIIVFLTIILQNCHAFSFDLDMTVDDEIRKNYNSSKLMKDTKTEVETLPALPARLLDDKPVQAAETVTVNFDNISVPDKLYKGNTKIRKGTTFNVVNTVQISDWQVKGTTVKFKTKSAINQRKFSIPSGTVFSGEIVESHKPQITCNGGLVVIRIRYMIYKGNTVPLNAYITRANDKMIFLNNIKGERTYLKTMWKKGNWGRAIFNRMMTLTVNLGSEGSTLLLSPFPAAYGTICLGLNTLTSPICAFFSKGKHISIPVGREFRIKLLEDAYID